MRSEIIAYCAEIGQPVCIGRFKLDQLFQADECFVCNSVQGIRSIGSINGQAFKTGANTRLMMKQFNQSPISNVQAK
jgi:branched-subunit amino acid aminotransferase/4-amino-4-deoxychorismate lyase